MLLSLLSARRVEAVALSGVLVISLVLRIMCALLVPSPLESDYLGYWTIANNAYSGHGLALANGQPTAFLSLGYPLLLSAVFSVFGPTIAAAKTTNIVLGLGAVMLLYFSTRRLFHSWKIAALASLLFATYLEAIVYTAYVAKENLMIFLLMAQLSLVVCALTGRWRWVAAVLFGLATGAMAVVGNAGLAFLPGLLVVLYNTIQNVGRTLSYLAVAVVSASLLVTPVLLRNSHVFGAYALNNNGGFNLYIGNNPNSGPYFEDISETPIGGQWQDLRERLGEHGTDQLLRGLAVRYMQTHPWETIWLSLRKAVAFWTPPLHAGKYEGTTVEKVARIGWLIEFCTISALFLAGTVRFREAWMAFGGLWLLIAGYTGVHMIFYVIYRYRLPVMPLLCIGAGFGGYWILTWIAKVPTFACSLTAKQR